MMQRPAYVLFVALVMAVSIAILAAGPASAGYSTGGAFNAPGYGARQWGMGGAGIAHAADEGSIYWNPAMLSLMTTNRIGFSYIDLIEGTDAQQTYIAWAHILSRGPEHEPGYGYNKHTVGVIYSNLGLTLADDQSYSENVMRFAYTYAPRYFFSLGASVGVLFSSSDVNRFGSKGTTLDFGGRLAILPGTTIAFSARNAMSQVNYEDDINLSLPRVVTLAVAYKDTRGVSLEGDLIIAHEQINRLVVGGEGIFFERILQLRGGLAAFNTGAVRMVPYAGLGIELYNIRIDYNANFDSEDALGKTHRFGLGIGF